MSLRLVVEGHVLDANSWGAIAGVKVRVLLNSMRRPIAASTTDALGRFTTAIDSAPRTLFDANAALVFALYLPGSRTPFYRSHAVR